MSDIGNYNSGLLNNFEITFLVYTLVRVLRMNTLKIEVYLICSVSNYLRINYEAM